MIGSGFAGRVGSRDIGFLAIFGLVALLIVGGIGFLIGDNIGTRQQMTHGVIEKVTYRAAKSSTNGKTTSRRSAEWRIEVSTPQGWRDSFTTSRRPEAWKRAGAQVLITYHIGRWSKSFEVEKIAKL